VDDPVAAVVGICVAAVLLAAMDIATITDKVNRKFNEVSNLRGLAMRIGRLSSTLPLVIGFAFGHLLFAQQALFARSPFVFFSVVGVMLAVGLVHGMAVRRIMFPPWFAMVYIFLGLLFGSTISHKGGMP
jgi:uncharacterized membrane protein AbrB (regulator of aidB expression)